MRPIKLIAEIGINHNGSLDIAKKLIKLSADSGWDAVKFQKRSIDLVYSQNYLSQPRESPFGNTQRDQKKALEFSENDYDEINLFCKEIGITWFASAWDIPSLRFLDKYKPTYQKVASAMITNIEFLKEVSSRGIYTFISTGMSTLEDIDLAVDIFKSSNCQFELMHSYSVYPAPEDKLNLSLIPFLHKRYSVNVGYSGHESSLTPTIIAAMLGATTIERHITLDRAMYGSDQSASLAPEGVTKLASMIRKIPPCIGSPIKNFDESEHRVSEKLRYWES